MILTVLPGARVSVSDMTGGGDHFDIVVASKDFKGKTLIDQHRLVFSALEKEMDKRIHAVRLNTKAAD